MIRRTLILFTVLVAAVCLDAGIAAPARAASPDSEMREAIMALRGLIDREGAADFFTYPTTSNVRPGHLDSTWWPSDPWTGRLLQPGTSRGHYEYRITTDRRRYRLIGHLARGASIILSGGMPRSIMLAYDHRSEEGINLIRQYIEDYAALHDGLYPLPSQVAADGAVGSEPQHRYWPSNPWDHADMKQRGDHGSFSYAVAADRRSYTLRLHRSLKNDYVLAGNIVISPWEQLLATLEDEILRRSGRILSGYVDQWSLEHAGALPTTAQFTPAGAVGAAHSDWPQEPTSGVAMEPGTSPGSYTYAPGAGDVYVLTVHLYSGDFDAGGTAPALAAPARTAAPGS
jgi:hypothetical protein